MISKQVTSSVKIPAQKTTYIVGDNLLDKLHELELFKSPDIKNFILLADQTVSDLYGKRVVASLKKTCKEVICETIPPGEKSKSFEMAVKVCGSILAKNPGRKSVLVTVGGGVTSDLGGFVGSLLLRGIRVIHLPTTLLAQIDASIGGKSGVDFWGEGKMLKNMIGKIEQPWAVISDVGLFSTLPQKEVLNGLGEMVKYWIGWGRPRKDQISNIKDQKDHSVLAEIIAVCQQIKLDVIKRDPFETLGLRQKLNLGHTLGHAIEGAANGRLSHGESVALGLVGAVKLSERMKLLAQESAEKIMTTIKSLGLPVSVKGLNINRVLDLISFDKKGGTFVLINQIGKTTCGIKVEKDLIKRVLPEVIL